MCGIAISRLGLNNREFYELSPVEFFEALKDRQEIENSKIEVQVRTIWESTRTLVYYLYGMNPYVKKKPKKPTDIFKLAWDKENETEQSLKGMKKQLKMIYHSFNKDSKIKNKP